MPRYFGITPPTLLFGVATATLAIAIALAILAHWVAALVLAAARAVELVLFIGSRSRKPDTAVAKYRFARSYRAAIAPPISCARRPCGRRLGGG